MQHATRVYFNWIASYVRLMIHPALFWLLNYLLKLKNDCLERQRCSFQSAWLRVPERIQYKISMLAPWRCATILRTYFTRLADVSGRRTVAVAAANHLVVLPFKLSNIDSLAFPVAAAKIWNALSFQHLPSTHFGVNWKIFCCIDPSFLLCFLLDLLADMMIRPL